jgi:SAM-dependent methyltransferase
MYFEETVGLDSKPFLSPFVRLLPAGARVLDVGCGSGRDLVFLKNRGFDPMGLERSPGLAALARRHSGCRVLTEDFELFDFSSVSMDAVLLSGSLVHVPREGLERMLGRVLLAVLDEGCVYVSLKEGNGSRKDSRGRVFTYWQDAELRRLFTRCGLEVIHFLRSLSADGQGKSWLGYVLKKTVHGK